MSVFTVNNKVNIYSTGALPEASAVVAAPEATTGVYILRIRAYSSKDVWLMPFVGSTLPPNGTIPTARYFIAKNTEVLYEPIPDREPFYEGGLVIAASSVPEELQLVANADIYFTILYL